MAKIETSGSDATHAPKAVLRLEISEIAKISSADRMIFNTSGTNRLKHLAGVR